LGVWRLGGCVCAVAKNFVGERIGGGVYVGGGMRLRGRVVGVVCGVALGIAVG
jgi:hypothetical protein